ncbi:MAG: MBL fold metallo-hydrolase RNA specificity domain-containing protein [Deltaproteobacteria bacterium]
MIEYNEGIRLSGTDIWFDSKKSSPFTFLSNADASRYVHHEKVVATPQTIKLAEKSLKNSVALPCPFNHPFTLGRMQVELIPAGYVLGSCQTVINIDGKRIIYTGDFKLRASETAESAEVRRCDLLVMKCTYGIPKYVFPSPQTVIEAIVDFIDGALATGTTPILLVDVLGKSQDIVKVLGDSGYKLSLHQSIYKSVKIYEEFGVTFSNYERFKPSALDGKVLLAPVYIRGSEVIERIERKKIGVVMGWAVDRGFVKSVFSADEGFPISNHAGYDELLEFVEIVKPEEIYLIQGFTAEFARTLQKRGFKAKPLETPSQLKLL